MSTAVTTGGLFATVLAKDLREQRFTLIATLGAGVLLTVAGGFLLNPSIVDSDIFARVTTGALGGLAALAVGCDLGSRDRAEGSQSWILRQPFSTSMVMTSKLVTFAIAVLLGFAVGALLTWGVSAAFANGEARLLGSGGEWTAALVIASAGLWSAAASSWLPRGFLAAPGGLIAFLIATAPAWIPMVWWELFPSPPVLLALAVGLFVGGLLAFAAGTLAGTRRWDSAALRAGASIAAGAIGMVPLWAAVRTQVEDTFNHDLGNEPIVATEALLAHDRGTLLVNASEAITDWRGRDLSQRVYAVDLATGAIAPISEPGQWLQQVAETGTGTVGGALLQSHGGLAGAVAADGSPLDPEQLDERAFRPSFALPAGTEVLGRAGAGWRLFDFDGRREFWASGDGSETIEREQLADLGAGESVGAAYWLDGAWLVGLADRDGSRFALYAPDGRTGDPVPALDEPRRLLDVAPDGRLLLHDPAAAKPLVLHSLRDGTSVGLEIEGRSDYGFDYVAAGRSAAHRMTPWSASLYGRFQGDADLFMLWIDGYESTAPTVRAVRWPDEGATLVGPLDDDTLCVVTVQKTRTGVYGRVMKRMTVMERANEVLALPLDGGEPRLLFPPAD